MQSQNAVNKFTKNTPEVVFEKKKHKRKRKNSRCIKNYLEKKVKRLDFREKVKNIIIEDKKQQNAEVNCTRNLQT